MIDARPPGADEATFIAAARSGDTARFALITERHRRELQVHCYRSLSASPTSSSQVATREVLRRVSTGRRRRGSAN